MIYFLSFGVACPLSTPGIRRVIPESDKRQPRKRKKTDKGQGKGKGKGRYTHI